MIFFFFLELSDETPLPFNLVLMKWSDVRFREARMAASTAAWWTGSQCDVGTSTHLTTSSGCRQCLRESVRSGAQICCWETRYFGLFFFSWYEITPNPVQVEMLRSRVGKCSSLAVLGFLPEITYKREGEMTKQTEILWGWLGTVLSPKLVISISEVLGHATRFLQFLQKREDG